MKTRINLALRAWLRVYDKQPFVWAMALSNLLLFWPLWDWVIARPLWAIPLIAFIALWASLITGSFFEFLRRLIIAWLHKQGPAPGGLSSTKPPST